jgi:hypothetical protein
VHEFVADSEADAVLYEYISRKAARNEVLERALVAEQPIGVEFDSGSKGADVIVVSNYVAAPKRTAPANDARYGRNCLFVQLACSVSER